MAKGHCRLQQILVSVVKVEINSIGMHIFQFQFNIIGFNAELVNPSFVNLVKFTHHCTCEIFACCLSFSSHGDSNSPLSMKSVDKYP